MPGLTENRVEFLYLFRFLKQIRFWEASGVLKFLLEAVWVDYGSLWKNHSRL